MIALVKVRFYSNGMPDVDALQKLDGLLNDGYTPVAQSHWAYINQDLTLLLHKPGEDARDYPQCSHCGGHHNPAHGCAFVAEEVTTS
jgi:hypothetical protein